MLLTENQLFGSLAGSDLQAISSKKNSNKAVQFLIDLTQFKQYRELRNHLRNDFVIQKIAKTLKLRSVCFIIIFIKKNFCESLIARAHLRSKIKQECAKC